MLGQLAHFGTGLCDIIIDDGKLRDPATHFETGNNLSGGGAGGGGDLTSFISPLGSPTTATGGSSPRQSLKDFVMSPFSPFSPSLSPNQILSPGGDHRMFPSQFSPIASSPRGGMSPMGGNIISPISGVFSPTQQAFSPTAITSPLSSPIYFSPSSPIFGGGSAYTPSSPGPGVISPTAGYSATSPALFSPSYGRVMSPNYSPMSPHYSPSNPYNNNIASPSYSPTSPIFSPSSNGMLSPGLGYSPSSPTRMLSPMVNPTDPNFGRIVASPHYSPSSPAFNMGSLNPQSPGAYSPVAQAYSPTGVVMSPSANPPLPTSPGKKKPTLPTISHRLCPITKI